MMVIESEFEIGATVYLKTDKDQSERMVTGIFVRPMGIIYYLSKGSEETQHYAIEISEEKNILV